MEKNTVEKQLKSENGWKILPLQKMPGSICSCGKEFIAIQKCFLAKDLSRLGLQINHYSVIHSSESKKGHNQNINAINTSLELQPQQEESSIFDSAWATLGGEHWQL